MVLDIILVAILVFFAAKGLAKGFVYTCLHTLGWIAAIVLAWFAAKPLADILEDGSLGMSIRDSLTEKFAMSTAALDNAVAGMPTIISGGISAGAGEASDLFVQLLTTTIVTLISFLAITVGCSILIRILVHPACKRQHRGLLHTSDRVLGLLTGLVEGVLLVLPVSGTAHGSGQLRRRRACRLHCGQPGQLVHSGSIVRQQSAADRDRWFFLVAIH